MSSFFYSDGDGGGIGLTFLMGLLDKIRNVWVAMAVARSPWMYPCTLHVYKNCTTVHIFVFKQMAASVII